SFFMKELMYSKSQVMPDTEHGPVGIGAKTQVGMFPKVFEAGPVFELQGVGFPVAGPQNLHLFGQDFQPLSLSLGGDHLSLHAEGGPGGDLAQLAVFQHAGGDDYLNGGQAGPVVEGYELVVAE